MSDALTLRELGVTFPDGTQAVAPLTMTIARGEFLALLGPSGCGKSTLLRAIAGLQPHAGTLTRSVASTAFVFQEPNLLPWRNVLRNVALPLELAGVSKAERIVKAESALAQVGFPPEAKRRYPAQLSGGMRMRASLARALVTQPDLLLLDEPFAALDELSRNTLDGLLRTLWAASGMTVLFVTHSVAEAAFLATRSVVFSPRPAMVVVDHRSQLPAARGNELRTASEFLAECRVLSEGLHGPATLEAARR